MGSNHDLFTKSGFDHFFDFIHITVRTVTHLVCNNDTFADEHGIVFLHTLYPFVEQLYLRNDVAGTAATADQAHNIDLVELLELALTLSCCCEAPLAADAIPVPTVIAAQNNSLHHSDHLDNKFLQYYKTFSTYFD